MRALRHRALACLVVLGAALALSACGSASHPQDATADNDGFYVSLDGVRYQLQISRQLNPYSTEDSHYVMGLPSYVKPAAADQIWYGVFLWAINKSDVSRATAKNFYIVDTQGIRYYPIAVNPAINQFAWTATTLAPQETYPGPGTVASAGPTGGALLLFKLNTTVYSNRPLTLVMQGTSSQRATISLNL